MDATRSVSRARRIVRNVYSVSARSDSAVDLISSIACGLYLTVWFHQAVAGFGTSRISQTALIGVTAFCLWFGQKLRLVLPSRLDRLSRNIDAAGLPLPTFKMPTVAHWLCVLSMFAFSLFSVPAWGIAGMFLPGSGMPSVWSQLSTTFVAVFLTWFVPLSAFSVLLFNGVRFAGRVDRTSDGSVAGLSHEQAEDAIGGLPLRLLAVAVGAVFGVCLVGASASLTIPAVMAAVFGLGSLIVSAIQSAAEDDDAVLVNRVAARTLAELGSTDGSRTRPNLHRGLLPAAAILAGVLAAVFSRMIDQLVLGAGWVAALQWASLLIGYVLMTCGWARHRSVLSGTALAMVPLTVLSLAMFPAAVRVMLELNSQVSSVLLSILGVGGLIAIAFVPVGALLGSSATSESSGSRIPTVTIAGFTGGLFLTHWLLIPSSGVASTLVLIAFLLAVLGVIARWAEPVAFRIRTEPVTLCAAFAFAAPFVAGFYNPTTSAKVLFDTGVFMAHLVEERTDILPHFDEGRCVAVAETDSGTLTAWRYQGNQLRLRQSGLPAGAISTDSQRCPQPAGEILQAVVPLVMHESPSRILLLGIRGGAVLQTSVYFPLETIACADSDPGRIKFVAREVLAKTRPNPLNDARVEVSTCDPLLALKSQNGTQDVVVCGFEQPASLEASPTLTREFLLAAAASLAADGIYCQPIDYVDAGADALSAVTRTWQSVFSHVASVEITPGRLLFLGSNSEHGLFRTGLVKRLKRSNVRLALTQIGWDWATALQLPTSTPEQLTESIRNSSMPVNGSGSPSLTAWLPWETMRWGEKLESVQAQFGPNSSTLQQVLGRAADTTEIAARMKDVKEQQMLVATFPDEYWSYRQSLKQQLLSAPRSKLVQVKGEEPQHELHSDEQRRLDYFETLGAAAQLPKPDLESLLRVSAFAEPFDPMISFFLHQEIAELAARNPEEAADLELSHRLHRIYFTQPGDRAVRNVVAAIHRLCEQPELIPDPADRGDQLDALMQVLRNRWHARGEITPSSPGVVKTDIQESIEAAEDAFEKLQALAAARGMTDAEWDARRLALDKSLIRPLRSYRTMLESHAAGR